MITKAKIVIDARMYNHSGIGTYLKNLLPHICNTFETTLLGNPLVLESLSQIAEIIPFSFPIYSISEQRIFPKIIPYSDIFWSPHFNVPLLKIKSIKRLVTIHDVYHHAFYKDLPVKQKIYTSLVMGAAVRNSDKIFTVSEFSKNQLIKYTDCKANKINVIHNGVNQEITFKGSTSVMDKYLLPEAYILFVGNVKPHKNLKTLLKAYLLLDEELKIKYKIVIVGKRDGFLTGDEELTQWINATPSIQNSLTFTGFVANEDLNAIYQNASLFVFPSVYEGFGLPPLEAMTNRCAVLASTSSSIPEVCGNAAFYFNAFSESDLTEKITKILKEPSVRQDFINKGLQHIKKFNWSQSAEKHIEVFNELLNN